MKVSDCTSKCVIKNEHDLTNHPLFMECVSRSPEMQPADIKTTMEAAGFPLDPTMTIGSIASAIAEVMRLVEAKNTNGRQQQLDEEQWRFASHEKTKSREETSDHDDEEDNNSTERKRQRRQGGEGNAIAAEVVSSPLSFLHNKVALITGGGGTIGQAIASKLVTQGAFVVLVGRTISRLETARDKIMTQQQVQQDEAQQQQPKGRVKVYSCDVAQEESVVQMFQQLDDDYKGGIDLLVNNAGISIGGETTELSGKDFCQVLNVNVVGSFLCAREALIRMKRKQQGRIINVGSISAIAPRPHSAPYTTSKFALQGLTQSLALDARSYNVAVGMIHPGNVQSGILSPEEIEIRGASEGFLQPDDVATCVVTMASLPYHANVLEMTVMPTRQPLIGRG